MCTSPQYFIHRRSFTLGLFRLTFVLLLRVRLSTLGYLSRVNTLVNFLLTVKLSVIYQETLDTKLSFYT